VLYSRDWHRVDGNCVGKAACRALVTEARRLAGGYFTLDTETLELSVCTDDPLPLGIFLEHLANL
jgi:hypothetical protein